MLLLTLPFLLGRTKVSDCELLPLGRTKVSDCKLLPSDVDLQNIVR